MGLLGRQAVAAERPAASLLPSSSLFYLEISRPKDVIALAFDHPLRQLIEQSPDFRKAMQSEQYKQFLAVVDLVEKRSSLKWRPALETSTGGGIVVAVDPATRGLIVLIKSQDPKTSDLVRDTLFSIPRDDATTKGNPDPIESKDYRGLTAWKMGDACVAKVGPWLLFSNSAATAKSVADLFLDGGGSLADEKEFAEARSLAIEGRQDHPDAVGPAAWGFVRLAPLRLLGIAKQLIDNKEKSDNPAAELLLGGILSNLRNSPFVTVTLNSGDKGIKLSLATPHDPSWVPAERKYYFAPAGGGADVPLMPKGTVFSATTYRDLPAFWQSAPDLFNEGVAGKLAQSDSGLSNLLGGKSFSTDIVGALRPEIQVVAARQDFKAQGVREPSIRLPAFAAVFRVKSGQEKTVKKAFRLAFQSVIAFVNLDGASKNRPPLEVSKETRGAAEVLYATYDTDDIDKPAAGKAADKSGDKPVAARVKDDTYLNFSPAIVFSGDHLILASTRRIAEDLADLTGGDSTKAADEVGPKHTFITADIPAIGDILREDREQLIAQNMLEKGHDRAAAEQQIDFLISLAESLKDARICLTRSDRSLRLDVGVKVGTSR